jgi:hypothetical protein
MFLVLGIESRASHMLSTEPHSQPLFLSMAYGLHYCSGLINLTFSDYVLGSVRLMGCDNYNVQLPCSLTVIHALPPIQLLSLFGHLCCIYQLFL